MIFIEKMHTSLREPCTEKVQGSLITTLARVEARIFELSSGSRHAAAVLPMDEPDESILPYSHYVVCISMHTLYAYSMNTTCEY